MGTSSLPRSSKCHCCSTEMWFPVLALHYTHRLCQVLPGVFHESGEEKMRMRWPPSFWHPSPQVALMAYVPLVHPIVHYWVLGIIVKESLWILLLPIFLLCCFLKSHLVCFFIQLGQGKQTKKKDWIIDHCLLTLERRKLRDRSIDHC